MTALLLVFFMLLSLYAVILLWLASGFLSTAKVYAPNAIRSIPVTILICARNEERSITQCLRSIRMQQYDRSKIQIILVNDASSDHTVAKAEKELKGSGIRYYILSHLTQQGKKRAISEAMPLADGELVLLRDADTSTRSAYWLQTISSYYQEKGCDLIIGPIALSNNFGILWALQAIETNVLALMACGSSHYHRPFLCNGANLAFKRSLFEKTNGYASHIDQPSGDDIFFLEDAKKVPGTKISYLKSTDAIVSTYPCYSFNTLLAQKVRWAAKVRTNKNILNRLLAASSFGANLAWLVCFVACYFAGPLQGYYLLFIFLKLGIDLLLLFLASGFIRNKALWWFALPVGCVYPLYAVIVALMTLRAKPGWK